MHPVTLYLDFLLGIARKQLLHRLTRRGAAVKNRTYGLRDRHVDALHLREALHLLRRRNAFRHMTQMPQDIVDPIPLGEQQADAAVAREVPGAGENQVPDAGRFNALPGQQAQDKAGRSFCLRSPNPRSAC